NGLTLDATVATFPLQRVIEIARTSASVRGSAPKAAGTAARFQDLRGPVSGTISARPETSEAGAPTLWTLALDASTLTVPGYRIPPTTGATTPAGGQPLSVGLSARATYSMAGWLTLERLAVTRDDGLLVAQGSMVREGGRSRDGTPQPKGQITLRVDA